MAGRRGVEEDVVEAGGGEWITQELGEFVKRRNLNGTSARQLLLHAGDGCLGQDSPVWIHDAIAVGADGHLGIDVEGGQIGDSADRRRLGTQPGFQDLIEVGGRIVLTSRIRLPPSASTTAVAHARDVLPTPPFPVKSRNRVGFSSRLVAFVISSNTRTCKRFRPGRRSAIQLPACAPSDTGPPARALREPGCL